MRIDLYTKIVLTLIAVCLLTIACKSVVQPIGVSAEGPFAGVQFSGSMGGFWAFDTKTGDVWTFTPQKCQHYGKITQLGEPLAK
jgi:hypothetical protein